MNHLRAVFVCSILLLVGCAQTSPQFEARINDVSDGVSAQQIFENTFQRHGGEHLAELTDVNVAVDGEWYYLITKIQPDVTDEDYRQQSEERILLAPKFYAALYNGEAGSKQVLRSDQSTAVAYNGRQTTAPLKEGAAALTADAFYMFVLGPLALSEQVSNWKRLADGDWKGKSYYRINGELKPGIGQSDSDFITLWVDKQTDLTFRLHITLEGFDSTRGAHVDTSFLNYSKIGHFTLPTHFFERVLGPIKLNAHEWWYTGLDINRGLDGNDVSINGWSEKAALPATKINGRTPD